MVAVMVSWPMVAKLVVAGDLNMDLLRTGKVVVAMLGFRTSSHDEDFFMKCFDNLITHKRDLSFGSLS